MAIIKVSYVIPEYISGKSGVNFSNGEPFIKMGDVTLLKN